MSNAFISTNIVGAESLAVFGIKSRDSQEIVVAVELILGPMRFKEYFTKKQAIDLAAALVDFATQDDEVAA